MAAVNGIAGNGKVLGDELGRISIVGVDAADLGSRHDHHVGLGRGDKFLGLLLTLEIDLLAVRGDDLAVHVGEAAHDRRADHAAMSRHINLLAGELENPGHHQRALSVILSTTSIIRKPVQ